MTGPFEDAEAARGPAATPGTPKTPITPAPTAETPATGPGQSASTPPSAAGAGWVVPPFGPPEAVTPPSGQPATASSGASTASPDAFGGGAAGSAVGWATAGAGGAEQRPPRAALGRTWIAVALVSALIGGAVGAVVTALADNSGGRNGITIREGSAVPGAALSGNGRVSIPSLVAKVLPAVVSIEVQTSFEDDQGSGMIISPDGLVVTNNHVIELAAADGAAIRITESGSTKPEKATLVGADPSDDVALLRINGASGLRTVTFGDSDKAVVGDAVVAIGNALGLSQGSPTVTQGIVSAIGRTVTAVGSTNGTETLSDLIQTDAAINPGNSGGPLIDTAGQVIGMNTAVAGNAGDGTNAQNIGFAIPSARIESLLPELQKGGTQQQGSGYIGLAVATLTPQLRSEYRFTPQQGAVILAVTPGSPADNAGLAQGDVVVDINSSSVTSAADLQSLIQKDKAGQKVSVTFYRGSIKRTLSVTLGSQQEQPQNGGVGPGGGTFFPNGGFGVNPLVPNS